MWAKQAQRRTIEALLPSPLPELKGQAYLQSTWGRSLLREGLEGEGVALSRGEVLEGESKSVLRMPHWWEKLRVVRRAEVHPLTEWERTAKGPHPSQAHGQDATRK